MEPIIIGVISGLGLAVSAGPVFLTIIQISIDKGFRKVLLFIAGVALADWTMIMLSWIGLSKVEIGIDQSLLLLIGSAALVAFGSTFLFSKKREEEDIDTGAASINSKRKIAGLFFKGVLMNTLNPVIWVFWAGVSQFSISTYSAQTSQILYFTGLLLTVLSTDILKGFFAQKLKPFFSSRMLSCLNKAIGIILIIAGTKFLYDYFFGLN